MAKDLGNKTKEKNWIQKHPIIFAIMMLFGIFFIIGIFAPDETETNSEYQIVNDENVLIERSECNFPNVEIGLRCCIQDLYLHFYCKDEGEILMNKLDYALDYGLISKKEKIVDKTYDISFSSPPNYYLMEDLEAGGLPIPYYYVYFGITDEGNYNFSEEIDISIQILDKIPEELEINYSETTRACFVSFNEEITKVSGFQEEMWGFLKDEEDKRLIKTAKGKEAFIVERTGSTTGEEIGMQSWYLKQVIFLDRFIVLSFSATSDYSAYVDEFDDFVNSFDFEV